MFFCLTSVSLSLLILLVIAALPAIVVATRRRKPQDRLQCVTSDKDQPYKLASLIEELRPRVLSYAIYVLCIERQKEPSVKQQLYNRYGKENMLPKLEECSLFANKPELMSDKVFLGEVNDWILQNGGVPAASFFDASNTVGNLLHKKLAAEAVRIVDGAH